jgi:hypothetical protein
MGGGTDFHENLPNYLKNMEEVFFEICPEPSWGYNR